MSSVENTILPVNSDDMIGRKVHVHKKTDMHIPEQDFAGYVFITLDDDDNIQSVEIRESSVSK